MDLVRGEGQFLIGFHLRRLIILLTGAAGIFSLAGEPPAVLPAAARARLVHGLEQARPHRTHTWRDTAAFNPDGTVNAYIEISHGDRRKWEYDIGLDRRIVDRVMPSAVGGYPVNYGFVPQTVSYDGDPFDALLLGPAIAGGRLVRGHVVGLMVMDDEKGHDPKAVLSPAGAGGRATRELTARDREDLDRFFDRYKLHEPGKFSKVSGWGDAAAGLAYIRTSHQFFQHCREADDSPCRLFH